MDQRNDPPYFLWKICEKKEERVDGKHGKWIFFFFFARASLSPRIPCLDIRIKSFHSRSSRHRSLQFLFYHIHASTCVDSSFITARYILGKPSGWIGIQPLTRIRMTGSEIFASVPSSTPSLLWLPGKLRFQRNY